MNVYFDVTLMKADGKYSVQNKAYERENPIQSAAELQELIDEVRSDYPDSEAVILNIIKFESPS